MNKTQKASKPSSVVWEEPGRGGVKGESDGTHSALGPARLRPRLYPSVQRVQPPGTEGKEHPEGQIN